MYQSGKLCIADKKLRVLSEQLVSQRECITEPIHVEQYTFVIVCEISSHLQATWAHTVVWLDRLKS